MAIKVHISFAKRMYSEATLFASPRKYNHVFKHIDSGLLNPSNACSCTHFFCITFNFVYVDNNAHLLTETLVETFLRLTALQFYTKNTAKSEAIHAEKPYSGFQQDSIKQLLPCFLFGSTEHGYGKESRGVSGSNVMN